MEFLGQISVAINSYTARRHLQVTEIQRIGKEANRWEEQFYLGGDPEAQVEYGVSVEDQEETIATIRRAVAKFGQRKLAKAARISRNTLAAVIQGRRYLSAGSASRVRLAHIKIGDKTT